MTGVPRRCVRDENLKFTVEADDDRRARHLRRVDDTAQRVDAPAFSIAHRIAVADGRDSSGTTQSAQRSDIGAILVAIGEQDFDPRLGKLRQDPSRKSPYR